MLPSQKEKHPQVEDRRWRVWTDDHGRKWGAQESKKTGRPAELLKPQGWDAPVKGGLTPERYFRFSDDPANPLGFTIDYDGLINAYKASEDEWLAECQRLEMRFPDKSADAIRRIAGPKPFPWQYWEACKNEKAIGHEWALGQSDDRPKWADDYFAKPASGASFLYQQKPTAKSVTAGAA